MTGWHRERTPGRYAKTMIAVTMLMLLLVAAALPAAMLAGVIMMMLGHVVGGLALLGGSVLALALAVVLAGMSGMRHLRKIVAARTFHVVRREDAVAEAGGGDYANVVRLDRSEYTEVR